MQQEQQQQEQQPPPPPFVLRSPPGICGGSFEYHNFVTERGIPVGAASPEELAEWPARLLERMQQSSGKAFGRILRLLSQGLVFHGDCSGRCTPEVTLHILGKALHSQGFYLRADWLGIWRGTDLLRKSQDIMLASGKLGPAHVFPSLLAKTPVSFANEVKKRRPADDAPLKHRIAAFRCQRDYIFSHKNMAFTRAMRSSSCLRHPGRRCQVYFQDPEGLPERKRPLTMSFVGMPCTPFTSWGNMDGDGHPAIEAVNLCLAEMSCSNLDILGIEESDKFPVSAWTDALPSHYLPIYCIFGPEERQIEISRSTLWILRPRTRGRGAAEAQTDSRMVHCRYTACKEASLKFV